MKRMCYSFENSGHHYQPLDGMTATDGTFVCRLYCTRCGRISLATVENNLLGWNFAALPTESQADFMSNPTIIRKSDA